MRVAREEPRNEAFGREGASFASFASFADLCRSAPRPSENRSRFPGAGGRELAATEDPPREHFLDTIQNLWDGHRGSEHVRTPREALFSACIVNDTVCYNDSDDDNNNELMVMVISD